VITLLDIQTPAVLADLDQVDANIKSLIEDNKRYGIAHRPHIKTHKSLYFAYRQLALGAMGVTCAKLGEAEVMAKGGIREILIAYPIIGEKKVNRLGALMDMAHVITIVNSREGALGLNSLGESRGMPVEVLIDVDGGVRRGGMAPYQPALDFAKSIRHLKGIRIVGLMYYGGTIYGESTREGILKKTIKERDELTGTAELLKQNGFEMSILSAGSSYSSKMPEALQGITESRAGHYLFNDCAQLATCMATEKECALTVLSTVLSLTDERHAIIDAGSKALTSDLCKHRPGYGYVCGHPELRIDHLNEEHGYLESDSPLPFKVGDVIRIIPNHCCVVTNLCDEIYGMRGDMFERMIPIEARGKNV
jgi:D-serine deaminase-like pyridoxal phosphate-dependent protein